LVKPCFIPNMLDHIIKCLRCVCPVCSKLLIPPQDIKEHTLDWIADAVTSHATYRFCGQQKDIICGAHRANYTKLDGLHIKGVMFDPIEAAEIEAADQPDAEEEAPKRRKSSTRAKKIKLANSVCEIRSLMF
jgi:hypothetical protein